MPSTTKRTVMGVLRQNTPANPNLEKAMRDARADCQNAWAKDGWPMKFTLKADHPYNLVFAGGVTFT